MMLTEAYRTELTAKFRELGDNIEQATYIKTHIQRGYGGMTMTDKNGCGLILTDNLEIRSHGPLANLDRKYWRQALSMLWTFIDEETR